MKTLALGVLAFRGGCPVTEAYLAHLNQHGMQPEVILAIDYVGEGPRARMLARMLGTWLAARLMRKRRDRSARVPEHLSRTLQRGWPVTLTPGREPNFEQAATRVIRMTVKDYSDPRLLHAMRSCGVNCFLYCSGGRVPPALFQESWSILHVHPGVVPHVRGSDGLLWSLLTRARPGVSCFYMDAGIDTGRVVGTKEFDAPGWPGLQVSADALYHALIQCYDPHLRAALLVSILEGLPDGAAPDRLDAAVQADAPGGHYYTMHPALRARVLGRLCAG